MTTPDERPPLPAPPPAVGILGCAGEYQAAVFHRGGQRVFIPASRLGVTVTGVEWERRLNETATARVIVAKRTLDPACCADLGRVEPWCHELAVYRDQALVWQGPILRTTEEDAQITIDALDVSAWPARLVNTQPTYFRLQDPARIAHTVLARNLNEASLATPAIDWPNMLPYVARYAVPSSRRTSVLRFQSIWADYVLTIINSMADKGFEWTTLGRRLVMRPPKREDKDRARARLTPEHLPGGISVIKDGEDAATRVFATSQTDDNPGITVSVAVPRSRAICGRLDMLVRENPRVEVETPEQKTAREEAIRKRRDGREDAADKAYQSCAKGARDRYDDDADAIRATYSAERKVAQDKYDADQEARRKAANTELKRIAALPDTTCNRKCKDDASDDERDARDRDIQGYRKTRDAAYTAARQKRDNALKARQRTRDAEIRTCDSVRDKAIQTARNQYESELAASNQAIQDQVEAETRRILTALAKQTLSGRWPVPTVIAVQQNARLSSEAPITVEELVPGERIDVAAVGFCRPVAQAMKLMTVRGSWSATGEEIAISLTPLTPILEED